MAWYSCGLFLPALATCIRTGYFWYSGKEAEKLILEYKTSAFIKILATIENIFYQTAMRCSLKPKKDLLTS